MVVAPYNIDDEFVDGHLPLFPFLHPRGLQRTYGERTREDPGFGAEVDADVVRFPVGPAFWNLRYEDIHTFSKVRE